MVTHKKLCVTKIKQKQQQNIYKLLFWLHLLYMVTDKKIICNRLKDREYSAYRRGLH